MKEISWGILSTAKIGLKKVIPAIQQAKGCSVAGIASRSSARAKQVSDELGIPKSYGSYKALLADPEIQVIYNPLPNHLHVPWTLKAMEAGKHVLCEKPIALNADEAQLLLTATKERPNLKVMEAFMYRFHPQWQRTKALIDKGEIGKLQTIESFFSYYNTNPDDIRNKKDMGGGGLMDIGCYCISISRYLFDREPLDIKGFWKIDPEFGSDYLATGIMDFQEGLATFTCSTQTAPHQRVNIVGTQGQIVIEIPFNAPPDKETRIWLIVDHQKKEITFPPVDQYTNQAEAIAESIIEDAPVPTSLTDALNNMKAIDAFRQNARELKDTNLS